MKQMSMKQAREDLAEVERFLMFTGNITANDGLPLNEREVLGMKQLLYKSVLTALDRELSDIGGAAVFRGEVRITDRRVNIQGTPNCAWRHVVMNGIVFLRDGE